MFYKVKINGRTKYYDHVTDLKRVSRSRWTVKRRGAMQLAATLAARRDEALFYRKLATLVDTVPLAESLDELRFRGVPRARFEAWCDAVGANTLRTAPRRWAQD